MTKNTEHGVMVHIFQKTMFLSLESKIDNQNIRVAYLSLLNDFFSCPGTHILLTPHVVKIELHLRVLINLLINKVIVHPNHPIMPGVFGTK